MNLKKAVEHIEKKGALLIFPVNNRPEPASLWSSFFPKEEMRWEWDTDGDERVSDLWRLRAELSDSVKVVYTKWYQGRATVFSKELFRSLLCLSRVTPAIGTHSSASSADGLGQTALKILRILEGDSPLSPKILRNEAGLKGKEHASSYERAMKDLWKKLLIVGFGEVDDGAFPSLAIGATRAIFPELWDEAARLKENEAQAIVDRLLPPGNLFRKEFEKRPKNPKTSDVDEGPASPKAPLGASVSRVSFEELMKTSRGKKKR
jgi:hypothetical protein